MSNAPLMLSVSGCRGIVGESLTPDVVARFAGCFIGFLNERPAASKRPRVVLGGDGRKGALSVRHAAISGLVAAGADVIDLAVATTPTVGVMVDHLKADGGIVLTASHNPAQWNGLKCLVAHPSGAHAPPAHLASKIIDRFRAGAPALASHDGQGSLVEDATAARVHVDRVLKAVDRVVPVERIRAKQFRVAVDCVNASGAEAARLLLDALACRTTFLNADGSGVFPHPPEPTRENLASLSDAARKTNADVCFAQDPDADRLAILDEHADYIGEEYTLVLACKAVGEGKAKPVFAANLSTSRMLDDLAATLSGRVLRTPVGEANVVAAMLEHNSLIGGEGNGGVIWPDVCLIRDSIGSMGLVLALMTREAKPLSEMLKAFPAYVIDKRKCPVRPGLAAAASDALAAHFAGAQLDRQDGLRIDLDADGRNAAWLHVRASNTEPILRLIAEARTADRAATLLADAEKVIASL
ncbi:MAG: phosphoglucosamine mutase [Phycisphaerales bacterium]